MHYITDTLGGLITGFPALLAALPLILVGAACAWLSGVRSRLLIIACSLMVPIGVLVITSQILGMVGATPPLVFTAALSFGALLLVHLLRVTWRRRKAATKREQSLVKPAPTQVWLGAVAGAIIGLIAWLPGLGEPTLPAQGTDDIWHGYLVARLADLPSVTAASVAPLLSDVLTPTIFYPYGMHLAAAALHVITGLGIPLILKGFWVAIALTLPFGAAAFLQRLIPGRPWAAAYGAVFVSAMTSFPYAENGVQAYALALAGVLSVSALAITHARGGEGSNSGLALVIAAVGLLVTHPAPAVTLSVLSALALLEIGVRERALRAMARRLLLPGVSAVVLSVPFILAGRAELAPAGTPAATAPTGHAVAMVAQLSTPWTPGQPVIAALAVAGIVTTLVIFRSGVALTVSYLISAALFVSAIASTGWALAVTGVWYGEWHRLVAVVALLAALLAGVGLAGVQAVVMAPHLAEFRPGLSSWPARTALVVTILAFSVLTLDLARNALRAQSTVASAFESPQLVTKADVRLFEELAQRTGSGGKVLNDWQDGSPWMFAMAEVEPLIPYGYVFLKFPDWRTAVSDAGTLNQYPEACRLLRENRVRYAVVKKRNLGPNRLLEQGVNANPDLFILDHQGSSGNIYELNEDYLRKCADL